MSEIQKCPNLVREGGQHFSKMSEIQKCPKCRRGGEGSTQIGTLSQIFSFFFSDASPMNIIVHMNILVQTQHLLQYKLYLLSYLELGTAQPQLVL